MRGLAADGRSPRSVARTIAGVRGFYRHLVVSGAAGANPADDLRAPRAWPALPRYLSLDDVERLIAAPDVSTPRGLRDRAFIELLYATGMRVSELVGPEAVRPQRRGEVPDVPGQGQQAAHRPDRRDRRPTGCAATCVTGARRCFVTRRAAAVFVNANGGGTLSRVAVWKILKALRASRGRHAARDATCPAAFLRHPHARARGGPAGHPDDARARRRLDHPDLHPRARGTASLGLRAVSSAVVMATFGRWALGAPSGIALVPRHRDLAGSCRTGRRPLP